MKHSTLKIVGSWSGGKDSCYALMLASEQGYTPSVLLNVLNEDGKISRSHGIPASILKQQAAAMKIPVKLISSSWEEYESRFVSALSELKTQYSLSHAVFGDIDLQAHRDWEEKVCARVGLEALLPLWQQDRKALVMAMIDAGIRAMIVSCNEKMGPGYLGQIITKELAEELESIGIDPCGENGEYHTLVTECPLFSVKVEARAIRKLNFDGYWFSELA